MSGGGGNNNSNNNNNKRRGGPKYATRKLNRALRKKQRSAANRMRAIETRRRRRAALLNRNVDELLNNSNSNNNSSKRNTANSEQTTKILDKFCSFLHDFKKLEKRVYEDENQEMLAKITIKKAQIAEILINEFSDSNDNSMKQLEDPEYTSEVFDNFCATVRELKDVEDAAYEESDQDALVKVSMKKMEIAEKILEKFGRKATKSAMNVNIATAANLGDDLADILNKLTL